MNDKYTALASRIEQTLLDLERVVVRLERQMKMASQTDDDAYYDAAALNLHGFYAGIERTFEDIAQTMGESLPTGSHWHQNLLLQMSAPQPDRRPAVISIETRYCLDEYRQFRHIVRNVYTFNFRSSSLGVLARDVRVCLTAVSTDLTNFIQFLNQLVTDDD
jgi:hypothetical protein